MTSEGASAFGRLHPSLQYVIATNLGWRSLRPIQENAIAPILHGDTTLIVAPTAGGKTEAAILPIFSRLLDERWAATSILYLAPLRALLNDLGERLGDLAGHLGLSVGVWHGDVAQNERRRMTGDPPDVLLATPESLEVLLSLASDERRGLLAGVRTVIIDEAHAFYGIDRGTQLLSLLERLQRWVGGDVQRIGLSATIGNPDDLVAWLNGTRAASTALVRVPRSDERSEAFEIVFRASLAGVVTEISRFSNEKLIAFCRTRSDVEEVAHGLRARGIDAWPHHSALSRENREDAEHEFRESPRGVLVATSTLELGIDIGDLDRVVQIDAPSTVASLLQRLGRTGRRGGAARMTCVARTSESLVLISALLALHARGWIEPLTPPWRPFPVLVQQMLATVAQNRGISRTALADDFVGNAAFSRIERHEIDAVIASLVQQDILALVDGALVFGKNGEYFFGFRNFMELVSVFSGSDSVTVRAGEREIGTLDRWFIDEMLARDRSSFLLNGQAWNVERWPGVDSILDVTATSSAEAPLFLGGGVVLSFEVMQAVREILGDERSLEAQLPPGTQVSVDVVDAIASAREEAVVQGLSSSLIPLLNQTTFWQLFTYAGLRANRLIADCVFEPLNIPTSVTNTSIKIRSRVFQHETISDRLKSLSVADISTLLDESPAREAQPTKFAFVLGQRELQAFQRERLYDVAAARAIGAQSIRTVVPRIS
jgi:ATP-dependent Lhr-like helicase